MASQPPLDGAGGTHSSRLRSPLDLASGLFLMGLGVLGLAGGYNLPFGTLSGIGSGLLPRVVAILVLVLGLVLVVQSFLVDGEGLERWPVRGPIFVLGAVLLFAMLIRGSTLTLGGFSGIPTVASLRIPSLGLIVAGPVSVVFAALADKDTRVGEIVVYSIVMTLICGFLFKELLGLPIPFDPAGLIPDVVANAYAGVKSALGQVFSAIRRLFTG